MGGGTIYTPKRVVNILVYFGQQTLLKLLLPKEMLAKLEKNVIS